MTTLPADPRIEAAGARTRQAAQERAAAYGPPKAQPTPKTDKEKKEELRKQRERFQAAGQRRFAAGPDLAGPDLAGAASAAPPHGATPAPCPGCGTAPPGRDDGPPHPSEPHPMNFTRCGEPGAPHPVNVIVVRRPTTRGTAVPTPMNLTRFTAPHRMRTRPAP